MLRSAHIRHRVLTSMVLVASMVGAACGGDDDASPATTSASAATESSAAATTATGEATTTVPEGSSPSAPTGSDETVKVMVIAPTDTQVSDIPEVPASVRAAADGVNARGGIGGRQLEVIYCNDRNDPNEAESCGRQAVDEGVAAVVGAYSLGGSARVIPLLEEAQIPYINPVVLGATDTSSPVSFLMTGDVIANFVGCGYQLADAGSTKVKVVRLDVAAAAQSEAFVSMGLAARGLELAGAVPVPPGTTDVNPFIASALADGTDGLIFIDTIQSVQLYLAALEQAGTDLDEVRVCTIYDALPETSVSELGGTADGVYVTSGFPPRSPGLNPLMDQFLEEMDAFGEDVPRNDHALNGWLGIQLLARVAADLPEVTGPAVLAALEAVEDMDFDGLLPAITAEPASAIPGLERVFGSSVYLLQIRGGDYELVQPEPIDAFNL